MERIHFTPKEILQKEFKQKIRGYDPTDVDSFLDMVIRDYETFNKTIQELRNENDQLRSQVDNNDKMASAGVSPLSPDDQIHANDNLGSSGKDTSFDSKVLNRLSNLSNRLSNLEDRVYGSQMNDDSHHL